MDPATTFRPEPVTLEGSHAVLEPLARCHAEGIFATIRDPEIHRYLPVPGFDVLADCERWIDSANEEMRRGEAVVFAIIQSSDGEVAGSTRYFDFQVADRGLEIGWTWLGKRFQRTAINTEAKYLLLRHAFETLGAVRVQLKTDRRNVASQRAIERIGGVLEGTHRKHRLVWDGHIRDTVYYSVVDEEWPSVKSRIESLLR